MNPDKPLSPREELEIRVTSLLMGELPPEEAQQLEAQIAADPELKKLHERLRNAVELLREASAMPEQSAPPASVTLSENRRQLLLTHFKVVKPLPTADAPPVARPRRDWKWVAPLAIAATLTLLVGGAVLTNMSSSVRVVSSLSAIDSGVDQYSQESRALPGTDTNGNHWFFTGRSNGAESRDKKTSGLSSMTLEDLAARTTTDSSERSRSFFARQPAPAGEAEVPQTFEKQVAENAPEAGKGRRGEGLGWESQPGATLRYAIAADGAPVAPAPAPPAAAALAPTQPAATVATTAPALSPVQDEFGGVPASPPAPGGPTAQGGMGGGRGGAASSPQKPMAKLNVIPPTRQPPSTPAETVPPPVEGFVVGDIPALGGLFAKGNETLSQAAPGQVRAGETDTKSRSLAVAGVSNGGFDRGLSKNLDDALGRKTDTVGLVVVPGLQPPPGPSVADGLEPLAKSQPQGVKGEEKTATLASGAAPRSKSKRGDAPMGTTRLQKEDERLANRAAKVPAPADPALGINDFGTVTGTGVAAVNGRARFGRKDATLDGEAGDKPARRSVTDGWAGGVESLNKKRTAGSSSATASPVTPTTPAALGDAVEFESPQIPQLFGNDVELHITPPQSTAGKVQGITQQDEARYKQYGYRFDDWSEVRGDRGRGIDKLNDAPEKAKLSKAGDATRDKSGKAGQDRTDWLSILADGTIGPASAATASNPVVGRTKFWTDDATNKLDINTASEGTYWDIPAEGKPAQGQAGAGARFRQQRAGSGKVQEAARPEIAAKLTPLDATTKLATTAKPAEPANAPQMLADADRYYQEGRTDLAMKRTEQALKLDPNNIEARKSQERMPEEQDRQANVSYAEMRSRNLWRTDKGWNSPNRKFETASTATGKPKEVAKAEKKDVEELGETERGFVDLNAPVTFAGIETGNDFAIVDPRKRLAQDKVAAGQQAPAAPTPAKREVLARRSTDPNSGLKPTAGNRSGNLAVNSNAIDALMFGVPGESKVKKEALKSGPKGKETEVEAKHVEIAQNNTRELNFDSLKGIDERLQNPALTPKEKEKLMKESAELSMKMSPGADIGNIGLAFTAMKSDLLKAQVELDESKLQDPTLDEETKQRLTQGRDDKLASLRQLQSGADVDLKPGGEIKVGGDLASQIESLQSEVAKAQTELAESKQVAATSKAKVDEVLRSSADDAVTVQSLTALLPTLSPEGKAEAAKHIAELKAKVDGEGEEARAARPAPPAPVPQPEIATRDNAFSTFSLNVSDVAFKLAGASLEQGKMPEPGTVRSEEFINALDYRDPEPAPGTPLAFATERARYPFAQNRDLVRFSVKTAAAGRQPGRPLNVVLLLDNSGSMERADRVNIVREALRVLAAQLQPQDKLSVITFARTPRLWMDGVSGDKASEAVSRVIEITPQGGTNIGAALDLGYATALKYYQPGSINRVVLLTDGAANLGNVDPGVLKKKVEAHRKQGVALDCFGIGWEGYDDTVLEALSRNGDGRYGFINSPAEAATEFAGQLAGALHVAASDVKVQIEFNPRRVVAYRQIGYAKHQLTKEQFRDNTVDAAEIGAAESGNALYVVEVNPRGEGDLATVRVRFKDPGTSDYKEHEWGVPFTPNAPALEQASPALRLAGTASAFSEWLASSPYSAEVTTDRLLGLINGVPAIYGADPRPQRLEWMIRQAKSVSGK